MSGRVATSSRDGVLEVTFENARRRNALSRSLLTALSRAIDDARAGDVRAVVLAGAGDGFSAGADLADLKGTIDDRAVDDAIEGAAASIRDCAVPVIAAVEGPCIGGALEVALNCDAIVAAEGAYFALPATHLGLLYNPRSVARLRLRLNPAALRWLLLLGERIDAGTGAAMGLVARVVREGTARAEARALAERVSARSPRAVAATKTLLNEFERGCAQLDEWERVRLDILASTERRERIKRRRRAWGWRDRLARIARMTNGREPMK